jgi:hypothetical protein
MVKDGWGQIATAWPEKTGGWMTGLRLAEPGGFKR